ncbi:MAG: alpha/beta hydrolase [Treponema sp.]|jgi:acetyl esterase/lipase|nr:alpha/beta hydrolase [Treponema sp.]
MPVEIEKDIVYKHSAGKALSLDLFTPAEKKEPLPVLIYFHGGGWSGQDKADIQKESQKYILESFIRTGWAVLSVNYTLVDRTIHFPNPITDCKDAVRWVRKNAGACNFDAGKIGLWGSSAGAHLAMMAAYSGDADFCGDAALSGYSPKVNFVIDVFGPAEMNKLFRTDMRDITKNIFRIFEKERYKGYQETLFNITGCNPDEGMEKIREFFSLYSPLSHVSENTVPTVIFHGDRDKTVSIEQSRMLDKKLTEKNVPHEFTVFKNAGHGFGNLRREHIESMTERLREFVIRQAFEFSGE